MEPSLAFWPSMVYGAAAGLALGITGVPVLTLRWYAALAAVNVLLTVARMWPNLWADRRRW